MRDVLDRLLSRKQLTPDEIDGIFAQMLGGQFSPAEVGAVLGAWRVRGEGVDELFAGAKALRRHGASVALPGGVRPLVDTCGTGGDGASSFNVSTAAAIVAASAGAHVAKHGNRSVSSRCGSADLLFAAGLPETLAPKAAARLLETTGFTFFFAPDYHPVLKVLAPVRQALGVRTIFNLLGPLANPLAPEYQLIGVGAAGYLRPMAEALARLGIKKALVVHSRDGLDEISPAAPTDGLVVEGGQLSAITIEPLALGIKANLPDLAGGDAMHNRRILERILAGEASGAAAAVAINAGAVLWLVGLAPSLEAGLATARQHLAGGLAEAYFKRWLTHARQLAESP